MKVVGERRKSTEEANLSGIRTVTGRASGETLIEHRRSKAYIFKLKLSGKRTGDK
jgi:hypothetical protein